MSLRRVLLYLVAGVALAGALAGPQITAGAAAAEAHNRVGAFGQGPGIGAGGRSSDSPADRLQRAANSAGIASAYLVAARGGGKLTEGARYPLSPKIQDQLGKRGWTTGAIDEAVASGKQVRAVNKATGNPATRHIHPKTGQSVVIDDVTGQVIHVGGPGFKYGPGSGDVP